MRDVYKIWKVILLVRVLVTVQIYVVNVVGSNLKNRIVRKKRLIGRGKRFLLLFKSLQKGIY